MEANPEKLKIAFFTEGSADIIKQSEPGFRQDTWREDVIDHGINSADGLGFVWEEANQVLGFICAHDLGFRAYISELIVEEFARRKGIGKKLVRHIEDELSNNINPHAGRINDLFYHKSQFKDKELGLFYWNRFFMNY